MVLQGTTWYTDLFVRHFLFQAERSSIESDDLLFFVRKKHIRGTSRNAPKYETELEVFRKDSKKLPIGDPDVDWEETVYLNLVIHQFDYTLTLAICTRTSPKELQGNSHNQCFNHKFQSIIRKSIHFLWFCIELKLKIYFFFYFCKCYDDTHKRCMHRQVDVKWTRKVTVKPSHIRTFVL